MIDIASPWSVLVASLGHRRPETADSGKPDRKRAYKRRNRTMEQTQDRLLERTPRENYAATSRIAKQSGLSKSTAQENLNRLEAAGLVVSRWSGRTKEWRRT